MKFLASAFQRNHTHGKMPFIPPPNSWLLADSCTAMHGGIEPFFKNTAPQLIRNGVNIIFSASVMNELARLSKRHDDPQTANAAAKAWNTIIANQEAGLCQICGDKDDETHADLVWLRIVLKYRRLYPLFVVTFDNDLADDIELLNHLKSTRSKYKATVLRLTKDGTLIKRK